MKQLDSLFKPDSIAIIGVSSHAFKFGGSSFLQRLVQAEYPGKLYPIHPRVDEILGIKCYPGLSALPETPDLAMICLSARHIPAILEECGQIGLKNIHILTSGFKEVGTPEGIQLENRIKEIASRHGLMVVGPNCMGLYCPSSGLTAWGAIPGISGPVGIISQSGGITQRLTEYLCSLGVGIAKAVSIGNSTVLNAGDFLEYMAGDENIKVVAIYLENVADGRRFFELAREINIKKPIVILQGGSSEAGARTIVSHTGFMGGSKRIWEAFFKQTGVIRVHSIDELVDTVIAFSLLPTAAGHGVFLASGGGGNSTVNSDIFYDEGLTVPPLSDETMDHLHRKIPAIGSIAGNPLDSFEIYSNPVHVKEIMEVVVRDPAISMLVIDRLIPRQAYHLPDLTDQTQDTIDYLLPVGAQKPTIVTIDTEGGDKDLAQKGIDMRREYIKNGIPAYPSPFRAARALSNFQYYHAFKKEWSSET